MELHVAARDRRTRHRVAGPRQPAIGRLAAPDVHDGRVAAAIASTGGYNMMTLEAGAGGPRACDPVTSATVPGRNMQLHASSRAFDAGPGTARPVRGGGGPASSARGTRAATPQRSGTPQRQSSTPLRGGASTPLMTTRDASPAPANRNVSSERRQNSRFDHTLTYIPRQRIAFPDPKDVVAAAERLVDADLSAHACRSAVFRLPSSGEPRAAAEAVLHRDVELPQTSTLIKGGNSSAGGDVSTATPLDQQMVIVGVGRRRP